MLESIGAAEVRIEPLPRPSAALPAGISATSAVTDGTSATSALLGGRETAALAATKFVLEFSHCLERVRWQVR